MKSYLKIFILVLICSACNPEPEVTKDLLDGSVILDPSLFAPEDYLLSYAIPDPTPEQALKPVIIACHGYTATTFEWEEFRSFVEGGDEVYLSQVLLGGHGRSYEDFKDSGWKDWQEAIKEEYERLVGAGYKNISFLGSSTSCALFLELLSSGYFDQGVAPRHFLLVDPIIIPSNKTLSLVGIVGPMLGYIETDQSEAENKVYYRFRPQETLQELQKLLNVVRKELEEGIVLPENVALKVYKSEKDPTADPVSAVLIYKGVQTTSGQPVEVEMVDSELHVYTRLALRETYSVKDLENQMATFNDILERVSQE